MNYDEELKLIQEELLAETKKADSLNEGVQGKDGPGCAYWHNAVSNYNRKLKELKEKYGK